MKPRRARFELDRNVTICEDICKGKPIIEIAQEQNITRERVHQIQRKIARLCRGVEMEKIPNRKEALALFDTMSIDVRSMRERSEVWLVRLQELKNYWNKTNLK